MHLYPYRTWPWSGNPDSGLWAGKIESHSLWGIFREAASWGIGLIKTQADYQGIHKVSVAENEKHSREIQGISNEEDHNTERNILGTVTG